MENNVSLTPVIEQLERLFDQANNKFYEGKLERPVITVSPDTKGSYGWCTSWRAWKEGDKEGGYFEINLCSEHLSRPFEEVLGTLMHEMVHLYCAINEIKDTSRSGTYHNKKFKEVAESHGLILHQDQKYGWIGRDLNEEGKKFLESVKSEGFTLYRQSPVTIKRASKSSSRKYVCPCCGTIIRATKEVMVICHDCKVLFEEA